MNDHVEALVGLDRGQGVRIELDDGTTIGARVNQIDYTPEEYLRLELASDESGDYGRYQVRAEVADDEWTPVEVRGHDPDAEEDGWTPLGEVAGVTPLDESRMQETEQDETYRG